MRSSGAVAMVVAVLILLAAGCAGSDPEQAELPREATSGPSVPAATSTAPSPTAVPSPTPTLTPAPSAVRASTPAAAVTAEPEATLYPLPPQPEGVDWPTESWPRGELPEEVDRAALDELLESAFEEAAFGEIHAVLLVLGGEVVLERYGNGYLGDEPHFSFSLSKSVTHALLGMLVEDGQIDMYSPAAVDEWADDERRAITPDMLLRMSSGLEWNENLDATALWFLAEGSAAGYQVHRELVHEPDTVFNYSTGSTAILGRIMGDLVGTGDEFDAWAHEVLFDPLGITSADLGYDEDGYWVAGSMANMNARDFARFGLLYLRGGVWDGERILPSSWVDYGRTPGGLRQNYGAGFWVGDDGTFAASGSQGQSMFVGPALDAVMVVLARNSDGRVDAFMRNLGRELFPDIEQ